MKTFKFLAALLLAVVYVGLSSCGKDDGGKNDNGLLVGTWVEEDGTNEITFNADGSGTILYTGDDSVYLIKFTYTFDSKTMTLTSRYENPETHKDEEQISIIESNGDEFRIKDGKDGLVVLHRKQ